MARTTTRVLSILSALALVLSFGACAKKAKPDGASSDGSAVTDSDVSSGMADSDSGKAFGLQTVNFGYDSSTLDAKAKEQLKANAKVLKEKKNLKVQLEGHCDERGGIQYNVALGEKRANAAKSYLTAHGIKADRLTTTSYGKEKPLDQGHDEAAWAKNRRANFRITEK